MTYKAYRATPFSHAHENRAFNQLHDLLQMHWGEQDEPLHLLGNFYVDGREIDALIIKRNALIVIDFKDYGGALTFSENGRWKIDGKDVRGGNKTNPYQQIRANKYHLLNYLKNQIKFQSSPELGHISGLCLFHQTIKFDATTLPHTVSRWFHIADMLSVIRATDAIVSPAISFSDADIALVISKFDVPTYHPDGRPLEVPIPTFEDEDKATQFPLNSEQTKALVEIKDWLADDANKVFSLAGAFYTGKTKVLGSAIAEFVRKGKNPILLSPNVRIANRYKDSGFGDVNSIYTWLYAGHPNEIKNEKEIYPVNRDPIDPNKDIIIIFDSHLLGDGDSPFELETSVYGSGFILRDFLDSFRNKEYQAGMDAHEAPEFSALPKILLIGDPYQLTRGGQDKSLLGCQIFEQHNIGFNRTELNSQDRDDKAPIEILDFQKVLIEQIKAKKFVRLPLCQQGTIRTISKGEQTDNIVKSLLQWPREAVYLCPTHKRAQSVNNSIRSKYLSASSLNILAVGDIVDIHNRMPNLQKNKYNQTDIEWVSFGVFAHVTSSDGEIKTESINLQGRKGPVSVDFAKADIEYFGGTATILYLPDFLSATKPELPPDQAIALRIWAREEADAVLSDQKTKLDVMKKKLGSTNNKGDAKYKEACEQYKKALHQYKTKHDMLVMDSRYTNVARLRYAYALTVHRAQGCDPLPRVWLEGRAAHDTENPATDSYFRWLYTATTCTSDTLQIIDYPELTPLSKTQWSFECSRLVPLPVRPRLYYQQDRKPTDAELETPFPSGFSNTEPRLLALLLTIYELINDTDWHIGNITQHNHQERYFLTSDKGEVTVDLRYNGKYEVSIDKVDVKKDELLVEIKKLLATNPIFRDKNIATAVDILKDHFSRKNWSIISVDEKNYKAYLIAEHDVGKIKLEINVPSDTSISKKGAISSVKVHQADSEDVANRFKKNFANG